MMDRATLENNLYDEITPIRIKAIVVADLCEATTHICKAASNKKDFKTCLKIFKKFIEFISDNACISFAKAIKMRDIANGIILDQYLNVVNFTDKNGESYDSKTVAKMTKNVIFEKYVAGKNYNKDTFIMLDLLLTYVIDKIHPQDLDEDDLDLWDATNLVLNFACIIKTIDDAKEKNILFLA